MEYAVPDTKEYGVVNSLQSERWIGGVCSYCDSSKFQSGMHRVKVNIVSMQS